MRIADLREPEALVYMWANPAIRDTIQQYFHPTRDHVGLVPYVAEVHAEDGFVGVHQREHADTATIDLSLDVLLD